MRYVLGIHLGATRVSAAVCRHRGGRWWPAEVSPVGASTAWAESILHVSEQGDLLVGQAALQRAAAEPDRVARAPLHRTGDPVPFVLGELSYPAETLAAGMIGWVADRVAEAEAAHAERIVVTHPPGWSAYRRGLLHEALDAAELPGVLALPSPVAAAECHLAREDVPEIPPGQLLAVCAVGGVHVETALLRRTPVGVELLAHSESGEHGAGCRLDDLVVRHVLDRTGIDPGDPFAMSRLRMACIAAKERLATTTDAQVTDSVSLTRQEFEGLARPVLTGALDKLRRLASRVPPDQLGAALLVGGTARVPLAASLARTMLSCPVVVDDDPGTATSRGAALAARPRPRPGQGADARAEAGQAIEAPATDRAGGSATDTGSGSARGVDGVDGVGSVDTALVPDVGDGAALATSNTAGDVEPPPGRPPVEITPLEPPRRRFSLPRRGGATDDRNEER